MITNARDFLRQTRLELDRPIKAVVRLHKAAHRDYVAGVVSGTPFDTGGAKGGWNTTLGAPSDAKTGRKDRSGAETIAANLAAIAPLQDVGVSYTQNAEEHMVVLDQGLFTPPNPGPSKDPRPERFNRVLVSGGFSLQAPRGVTDVVADQVEAKYEAIAART